MVAQASDIQQVVSKTQVVERLYQTQKQQPDTDQQKFASNVQQKIDDKNHQAQEASESEKGKILKDRQDKLTLSFKNKNKKKKKEKDSEEKDESNEAFNNDVGQIVDIKV